MASHHGLSGKTLSHLKFTQKKKLMITGLGGSYGKEKLYVYKMLSKMGPPNVKEFEFGPEDISWKNEYINFKRSIYKSVNLCGDASDAYRVLKLVENIYKK